MGKVVGTAEIGLFANVAQYVKGMDKAKKTNDRFKKNTESMTKSLAKVGALLGVGLGIREFVSTINSTRTELDKIGKVSDKIGLTAEALQELHFQAGLAGVNTQTLDTALQRMTRRVSEAAQGTGEAVKAIKELGININDIKDMTPDQQLKVFADRLKDVESQSDRVRLAMKLFDSDGVALVNMLQNGSSEMDKMSQKARNLGLIISNEQVKAVEKANDQLSIYGQVIDTVSKGLTVGLAKSLNAVLDTFDGSDTKIDVFNKAMLWSMKLSYEFAQSAIKVTEGLKASWSTLSVLGLTIAAVMAELAGDREHLAMFEQMWQNAWDDARYSGQRFLDSLAEILPEQEKLRLSFEKMKETIKDTPSTPTFISPPVIKQTNESLKKTKTQIEQITDLVGTHLENSMVETFRTWMDGTLEFKDLMMNTLKDIAAEMYRILVVKQMVSGITAGLGLEVTPSAHGNLYSQNGLQKFATGGVVNSPTLFNSRSGPGLMGEAGPEAIMPLTRIGGDLGVKVDQSPVNVNIINNSNSEIETQENSDGSIDVLIKDMMRSNFSNGSMDRTMKQNYGINRKGH